jgi:cellulose biosynthesis protein BcsQ
MFLDQNQPEKTLYHVLYEEVPLVEATQNISDNLYLAPASIEVAMLENRLGERVDGYQMLQIAPEKNDYDCVIIDTPPAIDVLKSNALIAASHIPWRRCNPQSRPCSPAGPALGLHKQAYLS